MAAVELVAIGASWGGLEAVERVLSSLPEDFPAAVVIAQHRRADGDDQRLVSLLGARCSLAVREAEDKQSLGPGMVLVAPADYHLLVEPGSVALSVDAPEHYSRPSIDVLLGSAADAYGDRAAGVVLTGANADGADGLARIARRGGLAIVQDPETALRREMPDAALHATPGARVCALDEIGSLLSELTGAHA
jgi:two-component system chemotaxis response regulator CheB